MSIFILLSQSTERRKEIQLRPSFLIGGVERGSRLGDNPCPRIVLGL